MKRTVTIASQDSALGMFQRPRSVSLPAEPFAIPPATTDETAPRGKPITGTPDRDFIRRAAYAAGIRRAPTPREPDWVAL